MTDLERVRTPEERELRQLILRLQTLRGELADLDVAYAERSTEIEAFAALFFRRVGVVYAETDDTLARIARAEAERHPQDDAATASAQEAQERAAASASAVREAVSVARSPASSLRTLFREAARLMHPDLAESDGERIARTEAMARANAAYAEGDEEELRRAMRDWVERPESVVGLDTGAQLVRTIRRIAQAEREITEAHARLIELEQSEWARLLGRIAEARLADRDLLEEMERDARIDLADAQRQLAELADA